MSDTPQTDSFDKGTFGPRREQWVDFARQLERERDALREENRKLREAKWTAVHSGGHWWIADEKTGDLLEIIAGPESEIAEAVAKLHNSVDGIAWKPA